MKRVVSVMVVVLGLWAMMPRVAEADIEFSYDLDSAIDQSVLFVEGDVTRVLGKDRDHADYGLVEIRVTGIIRDSQGQSRVEVAKGDVVTARIYEKLQAGDHLFLLANPGKSSLLATTLLLPVTTGVYRVTNGRVECETHFADGMAKLAEGVTTRAGQGPTVEEFRKRIETALLEVKTIHQLLDNAIEKRDARAMVMLLKRRVRPPNGLTHFPVADPIAGEIAKALGETQDFDALGEALFMKGLPSAEYGRGFATPHGMDYLLKHIADSAISREKRLAYVWAMPYADVLYQRTANGAETRYLARVAQLALDNTADTEIAGGLLHHLMWLPEGKDMAEAIGILQKLHKRTDAEALRHSIELICAKQSAEAFAALKSPCDQRLVVSARDCDPTSFRMHRPHEVAVTIDYQFFLPAGAPQEEVKVEVVAESQETRKTYQVELADDFLGTKFKNEGGGTTTLTGDLPADAPIGKYREKVRFSVAGKPWGESRSFEGKMR